MTAASDYRLASRDELAQNADPRQSALLVVDVQNDWCHEKGAFARAGNDAAVLRMPVPHMEQFLAEVRPLAVPVIHIGTTHGEWSDSPTALARFARRGMDPHAFLSPGSWGAEFFRIIPADNEYVITKHRWSAFVGTALELVLAARSIHSVVLMGVTTHVCVQNTALSAVMMGYDAVVLRDCTGAFSPDQHERALAYMDRLGVLIADSSTLLAAWHSSVDS